MKDRMSKAGREETRKKTTAEIVPFPSVFFLASSLPAFLALSLKTAMPRGGALCSL
jgi:hypothetical protein